MVEKISFEDKQSKKRADIRFNKYNVATLLSRLYHRDDDGNHYPMFRDHLSVEDVLDKEAATFFRRIYDTSLTTKIEEES